MNTLKTSIRSFRGIMTIVMPVFASMLSAQEYKHFDLIQLGDGIYVATHKEGGHAICDAGIVDLGTETLIFDTFMTPQAADELLKAVGELDLSQIRFVVNSHYHNAHIRGNQVFGDEVIIISTAQSRALMEKHEPVNIKEEQSYAPKRYAALQERLKKEKDPGALKEIKMWLAYYEGMIESNPNLVTTLPDFTFESQFNIYGASRNVELLEFHDGHTPSDVVMYLPEEKILFASDLLFIDTHPFMGDGVPQQWIRNLETIKKMDVETMVPGHGQPGNAEDIDELIAYLKYIDDLVNKYAEEGKSMEELMALPIPEIYQDWDLRTFYELNLKILYSKIQ